MREERRIDAAALKREACLSKRTGVPSEAFGQMILDVAHKTSGIYYANPGFPVERDEAIGAVALKCWEASKRVRCNQKPQTVFNFFVMIAQRTFTDIYRAARRRRANWTRFAAEKAADSSLN